MRFLIANPTASLYNNRTQVLAALEFACLDILGQAWGVPVCDILGGRCATAFRSRRTVSFAIPIRAPVGRGSDRSSNWWSTPAS